MSRIFRFTFSSNEFFGIFRFFQLVVEIITAFESLKTSYSKKFEEFVANLLYSIGIFDTWNYIKRSFEIFFSSSNQNNTKICE